MPRSIDEFLKKFEQTGRGDRIDHIRDVLEGKTPHRIGMPVLVERASKGTHAPNGESFHIKIAASTDKIARDGGVIPMAAWESGGLRNFEQNPVIQFAHDYNKPPIAKSVFNEIVRADGALYQYWLFHEESDESRLMKKLYEKGFMRAASVGFIIHEIYWPNDEEIAAIQKATGQNDEVYWVALRAEMLETSAVPVPADPAALISVEHALTNARAFGIDEIDVLQTHYESLKKQCDRGDQTACTRIRMPKTTNNSQENTQTPPDNDADTGSNTTTEDAPQERTINDVIDLMQVLRGSLEKVEERLTSLEHAMTDDGDVEEEDEDEGGEDEDTDGVEETRAEDDDNDEDLVEIEVLDGETPEQAVERVVRATVDKVRGAPQKRQK